MSDSKLDFLAKDSREPTLPDAQLLQGNFGRFLFYSSEVLGYVSLDPFSAVNRGTYYLCTQAVISSKV